MCKKQAGKEKWVTLEIVTRGELIRELVSMRKEIEYLHRESARW